MLLGCLGFIGFIILVAWAFVSSPILGILAILAGIPLIIWQTVTLKVLGFLLLIYLTVWGFGIHWGVGVVFIFIGLGLIGWDIQMKEEQADKDLALKKLIEQEEFEVTHQFEGENKQMIVVDETTKRFAHLNGTDVCRIYSLTDIVRVQLEIENDRKVRSSTGISPYGAALGGAIAGKLGAVVGGIKRKHSVDDDVNRIYLHIVVRDTDNPTIIMDFHKGSMDRNSSTVKEAYDEATKLQDLLMVL